MNPPESPLPSQHFLIFIEDQPMLTTHCLGILREAARLSGGCVPFHPMAIAPIFRKLEDPDSLRVAQTIESRELDLRLFSRDRFETMLGGIPDTHWPGGNREPLNGLYLRAGAVNPLSLPVAALERGALFVAVPSLHLSKWAEPEEALFESLAVIVHEHQHHWDVSRLDASLRLGREALERRAMAAEGRWRRHHSLRGSAL